MDPDPEPVYFSKVYWIFFNKAEFSNYLSSFFRLFICLNLMNHSIRIQEVKPTDPDPKHW